MFDSTCLQQIMNIVCNVFDGHTSLLFLPGREKDTYEPSAFFSLSDSVRTDFVLAPGKGLVGWIIRNNEPLLINNFDRKRGLLGYYEGGQEARIRAFMGCPLGGGMGALCLDSIRTYSFSAKDQKILSQFAQLISSMHVDQCRLKADGDQFRYYQALLSMERLRQEKPRWSAYLSGLIELLGETAGYSHCFLAARDEKGEHFFVEGANKPLYKGMSRSDLFPISSGAIGWVFRNNTRLLSGDQDAKSSQAALFGKETKTPVFRSIICLPLVAHRKTRGVLVLADEGALSPGAELRAYLDTAASHLSLFLENLYLKNRLTSFESK